MLAWIFLALTVGCGGLAWWQHARIDDLEHQLADAQSALAAAKTVPTPVVENFTPPPATSLPDEPPAPDPAAARQRGAAVLGALFSNPQVQQFAEGMTRSLVTNAYSGLVQQLNLSPEQGAAFNELLAQRALAGQDALRNATAQGVDLAANGAQLRQQVSQAQAQVDQSIHTLLGDGGFQQYQDYNRTLPQQLNAGGFPGGN